MAQQFIQQETDKLEKSDNEAIVELINKFIGFEIKAVKDKYTQDELKNILSECSKRKQARYLMVCPMLQYLVKQASQNNLTLKKLNNIVNKSLDEENKLMIYLTVLQGMILADVKSKLTPDDVVKISKAKVDANGLALEKGNLFKILTVQVHAADQARLSRMDEIYNRKDDEEMEEIFREAMEIELNDIVARIDTHTAKMYQKAIETHKKGEKYFRIENSIAGFKGAEYVSFSKIIAATKQKNPSPFVEMEKINATLIEFKYSQAIQELTTETYKSMAQPQQLQD